MEELEQIPGRKSASWEYYRIISLFSTFCVGLCMFGMIVGFVSDSSANNNLWGVLSLIFLISQSLLHFVDRFIRDQLSCLPIYLLNASRPFLLLRLYYIGLFTDIITLILTLIISYFFKFPQPIVATLWFVLLTTSWYNTNELRTYFVKSLEDVASCSDADCMFHTKLYNNNDHTDSVDEDDNTLITQQTSTMLTSDVLFHDTGSTYMYLNDPSNINKNIPKNDLMQQYHGLTKLKTAINTPLKPIILNNKYEKIVYSYDRQSHYHYNPYQHVLTSLDGVKSLTSVYIMIYCIWTISFIHEMASMHSGYEYYWGYITLLIVTVIQLLRICLQIWALSHQQPRRGTKHKAKENKTSNANQSAVVKPKEKPKEIKTKVEEECVENKECIQNKESIENDEIDFGNEEENSVSIIGKCIDSLEGLIFILLSPFAMRMLIMLNSMINFIVFVYGINNDSNRSDLFTAWAMGFNVSRGKYLIICYSLSILLIIISIVFLIRFLSQLSYLKSTGKMSYYKLSYNESNDKTDDNKSKKNKRKNRQKKSDDNMDINTFLKLASDDFVYGKQDNRHTLSTIDSSDIKDSNIINNNYNEINQSLDDYTTFNIYQSNMLLFDDDENDSEQEQSSSKKSINQPAHSRLYEEAHKLTNILNDEQKEEEHLSIEYPNKVPHMSLLRYIWFRIPYDKYFRITCCILSIMIILQTVSISPNVLVTPYREIMLVITFLNVFILLRITWSSSFIICWEFNESLKNHLIFPKMFLISYILGILSTNLGVIYMILRVYYLQTNDYESESYSHSTGSDDIISLNCSYYECFNSIIMMATWWPISILINNENGRFLDRYRKYYETLNENINKVKHNMRINNSNNNYISPLTQSITTHSSLTTSSSPYNSLISLQNKYYYKGYLYSNNNKNIHKICGNFIFKSYYPWINSIDGVRPLIPILFLLLLLSVEIGLIQWDNCLSSQRLLVSCLLIIVVASRGILLIVSI